MNDNSIQKSINPLFQNQYQQDITIHQQGSLSSQRNSLINSHQELNNINSPKNIGPGRNNIQMNQIPFKDSNRKPKQSQLQVNQDSNYYYGGMQTEEIGGSQIIAEFPLTNRSDIQEIKQSQEKLQVQQKSQSNVISIFSKKKLQNESPQQNISNQSYQSINQNSNKQTYLLSQKEQEQNQKNDKNYIQLLRKNSKQIQIQKKKNKSSIITLFMSKQKQVNQMQLPEFDMRVLVNVWQFIYNLRIASYIWTPKMYLNKRELDLVHDKSAFANNVKQKKKNIRNQDMAYNESEDDYIQNKHQIITFIENLAVLNPDSSFFYFWDLIHCIIIILQMFFVPIEWVTASTFTDIFGNIWYYFIYISITVFLLNVVLNFNVGFYDKGLCNMNRIDIFKQYIKFEFWADLLSIIPQLNQLLLFDNELRIVNFFIVFKIKSIYVILKKYQEMSSIKKNVLIPSLIRLGRLFFNILFAAHIIGCIFLGIGIQEHKYQLTSNNWISKYDESLIHGDWNIQYFYCLYWAVTTMTSVGYGDITPSNEYETLFVTFIMFVACFTFAYSFNLIGMLVDDMNSNSKYFNQEMRLFQSYFDAKNINKGLQQEIRKHLEYQYHASNDLSVQDEQNIIEKVPEGMKQKLIQSANIQYLEKVKFLKNFSPQLFNQLVMAMESISCLNNEVIFDESESQANPCIYFIVKGNILILTPKASTQQAQQTQLAQQQFDYLQENNTKQQLLKNYTIIKKLEKYEFFGEQSFLLGIKRTTIAKCDGPCHLLKISRKNFLDLINQNEFDQEVYCHIKDKCLINNNFQDTDTLCFNCQKKGHQSLNCPRIHYVPDKEKIILKLNYNTISTKRVRYLRFEEKSPSSYIDFILNIETATDVMQDLEKEEYEQFILKYYKLGPYEERMDGFFQVQNQFQPFNPTSSPQINQNSFKNSATSIKTRQNLIFDEIQTSQKNTMTGQLGNNFSLGNFLSQIPNTNNDENNKNTNSVNSSPRTNNNNNSQFQKQSNSIFINLNLNSNNKKQVMNSSQTSFGKSSLLNSKMQVKSLRKQKTLQKFSDFKSKLHEQIENHKHEKPHKEIDLQTILKEQVKKYNEEANNQQGEKKFVSKKLQNINYIKRLHTIQESTMETNLNQEKSQQQIQLEKLTQQQEEINKKIYQQKNKDQIETNFPSQNTDVIKHKGFEIYFPKNNIKNIIIDIINNQNVKLQRRNRSYHLYDRKKVYIKQIEQIRLLQIGIQKQTEQNRSQGRKGTQKRRFNNAQDQIDQNQINQLQKLHEQGMSYKQKKLLEKQRQDQK